MDDRTFRNAMGKFATGVTVITTKTRDSVHGMTANAFMSVSLEPKLITISIDNRATMLEEIKQSQQFAVNILREEQGDISKHFAGQAELEDVIDFGFMEGIPVVNGSLVSIVCDVNAVHTVGDHTLFIGKVLDIKQTDGMPLTFFRGKYGVETVVG